MMRSIYYLVSKYSDFKKVGDMDPYHRPLYVIERDDNINERVLVACLRIAIKYYPDYKLVGVLNDGVLLYYERTLLWQGHSEYLWVSWDADELSGDKSHISSHGLKYHPDISEIRDTFHLIERMKDGVTL